jgi:DNA polymerase I-like protein with 3'-5' exonuclease and polymerase domains
MSEGKIALVYDKTLGHKQIAFLEKVMFDVVGIKPENIVGMDDEYSVMILVGDSLLKEICGLSGILKYAGKPQNMYKYPIVPVVAPGYIEHNPDYLTTFAEHILTAYQISLGIDKEVATNQHLVVQDIKTIELLECYCEDTGICCFDFETTPLTDKGTYDEEFSVLSLSISFQPGSSYVIPLYHPESPFTEDQIQGFILPILQRIFANPHILKIGHHIKFDLHCAEWLGIVVFRGTYHDTMLLSYLYDENSSHKLKDLVRAYFPRFANYETEVGKNWNTVPLATLASYNALDTDLTLRLYWWMTDLLLQTPEIYLLYRNLVAPTTKVLFEAERIGMRVNKAYLIECIHKLEDMITAQEKKLRDHQEVDKFEEHKREVFLADTIKDFQEKYDKLLATEYKSPIAKRNQLARLSNLETQLAALKTPGLPPGSPCPLINMNSPTQLQDLLFTKQGFCFVVPKQAYSRVKEDSTSSKNLMKIKDKSGFIDQLLEYRQLNKIHGTYLTGILDKLDRNHDIHTSFNQHIAKTGRLSSSKPNLQNIITRTKYKAVEEAVGFVKGCFCPPDGYTLLQADYSQIELRVIAHYAQEKNMLKAYRNNQDLHELTAANDRGFTLEEIQQMKMMDPKTYKQYRYEAKASNFGFIYLISAEGFMEYARINYGMNLSKHEAEKRKESFFKLYPDLPKYHQLYINKAKKFKYVKTFFGQRVRLPDIDSFSSGVRGHAERNAVNSPIQGTAGQMTELAMVMLSHRLPKDVLIVNNVHDAIYFYVPTEKVYEYIPLIEKTMEHLPLMEYFNKDIDSVPIAVEFESSTKSWKDLTPVCF